MNKIFLFIFLSIFLHFIKIISFRQFIKYQFLFFRTDEISPKRRSRIHIILNKFLRKLPEIKNGTQTNLWKSNDFMRVHINNDKYEVQNK
jgi:hypothetical protein